MSDIIKMQLKEFLDAREGLSAEKVTILRYLDKICDLTIEPAPKQRSKINCYFDDGAYKGGQSFTINYQNLTPIRIANLLLQLTDGWSFSFVEAEKAILDTMQDSLQSEAA